MAAAPMPAAQALATLQAAGVNACKSPARGRCRTLCYLVAGQYVNLGRLRQLALEALEAPAAPAAPVPPAPGGGVAAHRAAAAAGRPVSLAALARDMGRSLGLASGGRLPGPAPAPTGDPLEGLPWDPGTPEARARHAEQGRIAAALYPIARAATGAGHPLPPSWWSDGPALNGELPPMRALEALPLPALAAAAAALAALPPVTEAQAQGLAYCRAALRAAAARL